MATPKGLATWDSAKQEQYRRAQPQHVWTFHFCFDASPSMHGAEAAALQKAYALYLAWLQQHADPMSLVEVCTFSSKLKRSPLQPLGRCTPLTPEQYNPLQGSGTALYRALGDLCTMPVGEGQHILVVFTDGQDNASDTTAWTASKVAQLLQTLQQEQSWLCVFLGAFPQALDVGRACGFVVGNCLVFGDDRIPEAFQQLRQATQKYLQAAPADRKLLAAGGIFARNERTI